MNALAPLIGRGLELAKLERMLRDPSIRQLTLTGTGGSGKTRLALQAAETASDAFPGGIVFVSLAPIANPALVGPTIARRLGLHEGDDEELDRRLATAFGNERMMLLIDNFEHVVDAAPFVSYLLQACPHLVVLVTSRMRLRLQGEREYLVLPLPVADDSQVTSDSLPSDAALLFIDRMSVVGDGPLPAVELDAIEEICRRLDGLPLAVELAAAWSRVLRPSALLARLEPALPMLVGGNRDAPERQRTVRAAIQWSYDLLAPEEQSLFRALGVFRGGFTLDSIEAVAGNDRPDHLLATVAGLVEKSLLVPVVAYGGEPRFTMLETLREFAVEQLDAAGEASRFQERHARHFVETTQRWGPLLQFQQDTHGSIARLDEEQDNIRAALVWAFDNDPLDALLRLVYALQPYWMLRGRLQEGRQWLERALPISEAAPLPLRALTVRACAWHSRYLGNYQRADELGQIALDLANEAGDRYGVAHSMTLLGQSALEKGHFVRATAIFEDVLACVLELGDQIWVAWAVRNIGRTAQERGDLATARTMIDRAICLFEQANCSFGLIEAEDGLALLAVDARDFGEAARRWRNRIGPWWDEYGLCYAMEGLGDVAIALNRWEDAAHLLSAAAVHRERMGVPVHPSMHARYERTLETVRSALDPLAFETAWDAGRRCGVAEAHVLANAFAGEIADAAPAVSQLAPTRFGLTRRELQVLELVAAGRTNRQIADELFISLPTVKRHLTTVYGKLGVDSRRDAVAVLFETATR
jgi:predicted ATPase/DNA-binding CsgD family transcriptional regulator